MCVRTFDLYVYARIISKGLAGVLPRFQAKHSENQSKGYAIILSHMHQVQFDQANALSFSATSNSQSSLTFDPTKSESAKSQAESLSGYSAVSITSALDPSREYSRPSTADGSTYTTNTARSMDIKSAGASQKTLLRTLMSLDQSGWSNASRTPSVGSISRPATAHGDKHQAAKFSATVEKSQTEGPRTLAQVEMHLHLMRQRASNISRDYSKLASLSSMLTLQRQYNITVQNLESENNMILALVDKIIHGGSTQKVLAAIKQLKPIMQMMQVPLFERMPLAQFSESDVDHVKAEIQVIVDRLSETSKQKLYPSSFTPWNTDPSETWVSDKASLLIEVIDQQLDTVGDEILGDVMRLYDVNQKLTRVVSELAAQTFILSSLDSCRVCGLKGKMMS